jgi:hypothetical protein
MNAAAGVLDAPRARCIVAVAAGVDPPSPRRTAGSQRDSSLGARPIAHIMAEVLARHGLQPAAAAAARASAYSA